MRALNHRLTFCVLICQEGTPFGANCAKAWVHFHRPWNYWGPKWLLSACSLQPLHHSQSVSTVKEEPLWKWGAQSTHICPRTHRGAETYFTEMYACSRDSVSRMEQEANAAEAQKDTCYRNNSLSQRPKKHENKQLRIWLARPAAVINMPKPCRLLS